jgi:hypothetical protein
MPGALPIVLPAKPLNPRSAKPYHRSEPLVIAATRMADPVLWVRRHAQNVQRILQLRNSLGLDLDRLQATFDERVMHVAGRATKADPPLPDDSAAWGPRVRLSARPAITVPLINPPWTRVLRDLVEDDGPRTGPGQYDRSRRIIKALLDPNLGDVARVYDSTSGDSPFRFRALIQVIYWQLADRLSSGEGPRQCRCGGWWIPTDNRQRDHPACYMKFYMQDKRAHERRSKGRYSRKRSRGGRRR